MSLYSKIQIHLPVRWCLRRPPAQEASKQVLLICDDALGDVLIMSGLVRQVKAYGWSPTLIIRDTWQDFAPFLWADDVLPVNIPLYKTSLRYRIEFLNKVRQKKYEWAAASLLLSGVSANILGNCGAPVRYAYCREGLKKKRLWGANKIIPALPWKQSPTQYTDILQLWSHYYSGVLGQTLEGAQVAPSLQIKQPPEVFAGLEPGKYIHYILDTADAIRQYPPEKLLPLLGAYGQKHGLHVAVTAKDPCPAVKTCPNVTDLTGKTSLKQLWQIIYHARGVVGNETGSTHLAWILHKPTVMLYGGGHNGLFRPAPCCQVLKHPMPCFGCSWTACTYKQFPAPCVQGIAPVQIEEALEKICK